MDRLLGFLARRAVLSILLVLFAVFTVLQPSIFLSEQNVANVARQVSFNGIIALGETVVLISGGIDISVGAVLSMAAALTMKLQPLGVGVAVSAALLFGLAVGVINGLLVTRDRYSTIHRHAGQHDGRPGIDADLHTAAAYPGAYRVVHGLRGRKPGADSSTGALPHRRRHILLTGGSTTPAADATSTRSAAILKRRGWRASTWICIGSCHTSSADLCRVVRGAARLIAQYLDHSYRTRHSSGRLGGGNHGRRQFLGGRGSVAGTLLGVLALGMLSNGMDSWASLPTTRLPFAR